MAETKHSQDDDPDIVHLKNLSKKGASNVVGEILKDPQIQNQIKSALLAETIKNSIVLTCLLVGLLKLYDVVKTVVAFDWKGDLLMSIILVSIGLIYLTKNMLSLRKNGHPKTDRGDSNAR